MPILPRKTVRSWFPARRSALRLTLLGMFGWLALASGYRLPVEVSLRFRIGLQLLVLFVLYLAFKATRQAVSRSTTVIAQYRIPRMQYLYALAFALQSLVFLLPTR
jgi:hypothetical protein